MKGMSIRNSKARFGRGDPPDSLRYQLEPRSVVRGEVLFPSDSALRVPILGKISAN